MGACLVISRRIAFGVGCLWGRRRGSLAKLWGALGCVKAPRSGPSQWGGIQGTWGATAGHAGRQHRRGEDAGICRRRQGKLLVVAFSHVRVGSSSPCGSLVTWSPEQGMLQPAACEDGGGALLARLAAAIMHGLQVAVAARAKETCVWQRNGLTHARQAVRNWGPNDRAQGQEGARCIVR